VQRPPGSAKTHTHSLSLSLSLSLTHSLTHSHTTPLLRGGQLQGGACFVLVALGGLSALFKLLHSLVNFVVVLERADKESTKSVHFQT
jgi:hypothetical protein